MGHPDHTYLAAVHTVIHGAGMEILKAEVVPTALATTSFMESIISFHLSGSWSNRLPIISKYMYIAEQVHAKLGASVFRTRFITLFEPVLCIVTFAAAYFCLEMVPSLYLTSSPLLWWGLALN